MSKIDYTTGEDSDAASSGKYLAHIADSEIVKSRAGDNMLKLRWELCSGNREGDAEWQNLNLWNPNPTAKRLAYRTMDQICKAIGVKGKVEDSSVLHEKPCFIHIRAQKNNPDFTEIWKVEASGPAPAKSNEPTGGGGSGDAGAEEEIPF